MADDPAPKTNTVVAACTGIVIESPAKAAIDNINFFIRESPF
jgi:hypothetical protein